MGVFAFSVLSLSRGHERVVSDRIESVSLSTSLLTAALFVVSHVESPPVGSSTYSTCFFDVSSNGIFL